MSAKVPQVIAKLRGNLRIDEGDLKNLLTEKVNQRLYISLIDKLGGTLKETVWPSQTHDGVGYLFAVLKVAVEPDEREWSKRSVKGALHSLRYQKSWRCTIIFWSKLF